MRIRFYICFSLLVLLAFCGCGGSSEIEMQQAKDAMDHAKRLHADNLAPADFQQAQKAWDHALDAEKGGKTGAAKVLFTSAKIYFGKAADIAKSKESDLSRELSAMQLTIGRNFDQVKMDLINKNLSLGQQGQVKAIASEVEKGKDSISKMVIQGDLLNAVATAKDLQTKIYHAQLILAGKKPGK
jgi:hypothetical protein